MSTKHTSYEGGEPGFEYPYSCVYALEGESKLDAR